MDYYKKSMELHRENKGKWEIHSKTPVVSRDDLSTVYTPGVAEPCREILKDPNLVYEYTAKQNTVAVITDGTAVLGLGDIGAKASIPVMEGKAILLKEFGGVDALPICLNTKDVDEIVFIVKNIASTFGGINLEDISAPRCFEVERLLQNALDIPVFHDDQHGTAIVTAAALLNALKVTERQLKWTRILISGAGAAGTAITKMLLAMGAEDIVVCDIHGILCDDDVGMDDYRKELARLTNKEKRKGGLAEGIEGRDVFIGVSAPKILTVDMVKTMAKDAVIFAMANPEPEILPELAFQGGAKVVGTGRSDYPNQINNVLVFPGLFRGALDARAGSITDEMKVAAVYALAEYLPRESLRADNIVPDVLDKNVSQAIAKAVMEAWKKG